MLILTKQEAKKNTKELKVMNNKKKQMQQMYAHGQLIEMERNERILDHDIYQTMGLVNGMQDVKSIAEYDYLRSVSQRTFQRTADSTSFWMEGYPLEITPIRSTENFHQIEWSLENGDFLTHPFALSDGLDENYQKFLSVIRVAPFGKWVPTDILVKKCGLLVTSKIEGDEVSYYLHDICSVEELVKHRLKALANSHCGVKMI